jgi:shikimate dehydrogenase
MTSVDRYAVFGQPIKHSKSPRIHQLFAEQTGQALSYTAEEVSAEQFAATAEAFFAQGGKGLNCTVPLKELAWRFTKQKTKKKKLAWRFAKQKTRWKKLAWRFAKQKMKRKKLAYRFATERADLAKAVNTLSLQVDGSIVGDNTDGCGLVRDLMVNHQINLEKKRILILGAGGATLGIISPLAEKVKDTIFVANRTFDKATNSITELYDLCEFVKILKFADLIDCEPFDVILNATSASLSGQLPPLPNGLLVEQGVCYDLAYGNEPTAFVRWGLEQHAAKSLDGLGMLVEQAAEAFFIWRGVRPDTQSVIALLNSERGL